MKTTSIMVALILMTSCQKMNTRECQNRYDDIMNQFYQTVDELEDQNLSPSLYRKKYNEAVVRANGEADKLKDCMGWQNLKEID